MNKFRASTNDEIERLKNQLKWQVSDTGFGKSLTACLTFEVVLFGCSRCRRSAICPALICVRNVCMYECTQILHLHVYKITQWCT